MFTKVIQYIFQSRGKLSTDWKKEGDIVQNSYFDLYASHRKFNPLCTTADESKIKMLQDTHVFCTRQFWRLGDLL